MRVARSVISKKLLLALTVAVLASPSAFAQEAKSTQKKDEPRNTPVSLPDIPYNKDGSGVRATINVGGASVRSLVSGASNGGMSVGASLAAESSSSYDKMNYGIAARGLMTLSGLEAFGNGAVDLHLGSFSTGAIAGYEYGRSPVLGESLGSAGLRMRRQNVVGSIRYQGGNMSLPESESARFGKGSMGSSGVRAKVEGGAPHLNASADIGINSLSKGGDDLDLTGSAVTASVEMLGRLGRTFGLGVGYDHRAVNASYNVKRGQGPAQVVFRENYKAGMGQARVFGQIAF
jgi:hypothetical protein